MDEDCGEMGIVTVDLRQRCSSRLSEAAAASDNEEINMGDGSMTSVEDNENSRLMGGPSVGGSGARNRRAKFHSETDIKKSLEEFSRSFQLTKGERFRTGSGTNLNNNNFVKNFGEDTGEGDEDDEAASEESGDRVGNLTSVTTGGGGVGTKLMNRTHAQMPCPEFRRSPARSSIL